MYEGIDQSDFVGLLLHFMIPAPVSTPLTVAAATILLENVDPTYFWFRDFILISSPVKMLLRISIMSIVVFHGAMAIFTFLVNLANVALSFHCCLRSMTSTNYFRNYLQTENDTHSLDIATQSRIFKAATKFGNSARFSQCLIKYRQLQIVAAVQNQVLIYLLPISLVVAVAGCVVVGYLVIKLTGAVPIPLSILCSFVLVLIIAAAHALIPLAAEVFIKSEFFVRFWKLQSFSGYRKRQLKSCKLLRISVGPFFRIKKGSRVIFLSVVLYHTVTLVISV